MDICWRRDSSSEKTYVPRKQSCLSVVLDFKITNLTFSLSLKEILFYGNKEKMAFGIFM